MMLPYASSSSTAVSQGYSVFLSFRGEDTRNNFIGHLYDALTRNDITTFKDDKTLEIGNHIASELLEAIDTSRIAIVVLSANFATSKWCLKEIARIADCMKRKKLTVIPIFYHVSPSDVRRQSNSFIQGFANHKQDTEITQEKVETWRAAFEEVGLISGLHVTEHSVEAEVINEIVRKVLRCLRDTQPTDLPNGLVGIDSRLEEVKRKLRMHSNEVLFIGICGKSGIGKTTLAEVVYENIKDKFEKSCFIESIKDISKQNNSSDLRKFQQTILDEILKEKHICVQTVKNGQTLLGTRLRGFKVIIVLDDVNNVDQLTYLADRHEWFGPGSRIIITTTEVELLNAHKVNDIYWCEDMEGDEALRLFCRSAFEQSHPMHGYEDMSNGFLKLAGGLPSALNAYGKLLYGKDKNYWKETLKMQIDGAGGNNKNQGQKGGNSNGNSNNNGSSSNNNNKNKNELQQQQGKGTYGSDPTRPQLHQFQDLKNHPNFKDNKMPSFRGGGSGGDGVGKNVPNDVKVVFKTDESEDDFDDFDDDDDDEFSDTDDSPVKKPVMVGNQCQMDSMLPPKPKGPQFMNGAQMPPPFVKGGQMPHQQTKHGAPPMINNGGIGNGGKKEGEVKKGGISCIPNKMGMTGGGGNPRLMGNMPMGSCQKGPWANQMGEMNGSMGRMGSMPMGSHQKGPWIDQMGEINGSVGRMGNMPMGSRQMGPWVGQMGQMNGPMGHMGNMQAVQGLPTGPKMNGGSNGGNFQGGGREAMADYPHYPQQLMMETMMNQQNGNGGERFCPMMYAWPPPAVNYMQPQPQQYQQYPLHHYPHPPQRDSFIRCFSIENTSCCSMM